MWNKRLDEEQRGRRLSASTLRMGQRGKNEAKLNFYAFPAHSASRRFALCAKSKENTESHIGFGICALNLHGFNVTSGTTLCYSSELRRQTADVLEKFRPENFRRFNN